MIKPYYDHAGITIYHGDCREILLYVGDVDLVLTDPPYGIGRSKTNKGPGWVDHEDRGWDKSIPPAEYFTELYRVSKNQIIWGGNYFVEHIKPSMGWLVWDKENSREIY